MFGIKKRLLANLERLTTKAQMAVWAMLMTHFQIEPDQEGLTLDRVRAWTLYLFGKPPSPHFAHLYLDAEYRDARRWLSENELALHLVVQSLRVTHIVAYEKTGTAPTLGLDLLSSFGGQVPPPTAIDTTFTQ